MAKTLGVKSILIRQAITDNPDKGNTEIAEMLNDAPERMDDKIKVTAQDVAQQKQQMKKAGTAPTEGKKRGRPAAQPPIQPATPVPTAPLSASPASPLDLTDDLASIKRLVQKLGAEQVSKIARLFD